MGTQKTSMMMADHNGSRDCSDYHSIEIPDVRTSYLESAVWYLVVIENYESKKAM